MRHLKKHKGGEDPCYWTEIFVNNASGNLSGLVLQLLMKHLSLYDVFSMREVCCDWKRRVDAYTLYWDKVCAHLKCETFAECSYFSLYGITDGQMWDLVTAWRHRARELLLRIVQAYLHWPRGRLWRVDEVSDKKRVGEYPYRFDDKDAAMFYYEGVRSFFMPVRHEFFFCKGQSILHREGRRFAWRAISILELTQSYVDFVNEFNQLDV